MGETQVGLQARLMSQALRKLAGNLNRANTVCVFTNQIREKIGVMFGSPGDPAGRPGAEVLLLAAARHPPHRDPQGGHRGGRQPGPGEGGQEQGRGAASARPSSTSSTAPGSRTRAACSTSRWSTTWSRSRARSSPTASCGSARAATTPSSTWPRTRRSPARSRRSCSRRSASSGPPRRPASPTPIADAAERGRSEPEREGRLGVDGVGRPPNSDAFEVALAALRRKERTNAELDGLARERGYGAGGGRGGDRPPDRGRASSTTSASRGATPRTSASCAAGAPSGSARPCWRAGSRPPSPRRRWRRTRTRPRSRRARELLDGRSPAPGERRRSGPGARLPDASRLRVRGRLRGDPAGRPPGRLSSRLPERCRGSTIHGATVGRLKTRNERCFKL